MGESKAHGLIGSFNRVDKSLVLVIDWPSVLLVVGLGPTECVRLHLIGHRYRNFLSIF